MAGTVRDTKQHGQTIGESLSGIEIVPRGKARIYIGKTAFESLIEATFDDSLGIGSIESSVEDPIQMAVEDLEDLMPGISNVFNEDNEVNISAHIDNIIDMKLDGDEENILLSASVSVDFSNPLNDHQLCANARTIVKGTADLSVDETKLQFSLDFTVADAEDGSGSDNDKDDDEDKDGSGDDDSVDKPGKVVKRFEPYFETEATTVDFEEEYLEDLYTKVVDGLNEKLSEGFLLPL